MQNVVQDSIWKKANASNFEQLALEVYHFQLEHNPIYRAFVHSLYKDYYLPKCIEEIPFLPIELFKTKQIQTGHFKAERTFRSSGTTSTARSERSTRVLKSLNHYRECSIKAFEEAIGKPDSMCILALLPSYLERKDASLVQMVEFLIDASQDSRSGFYLNQHEKLIQTLEQLVAEQVRTVLFGVSFALLDLIESRQIKLSQDIIVLETGGMKGRRKEMIKEELYLKLREGFGIEEIGSEYGMTELLSQAYSKNNGLYKCPPWMKVLIRENTDPLEVGLIGKRGAVNIIDLASTDACAFIQTSDLGLMHHNATFEILGRMDNSDIRGCSQMI